MALNDTIQPTMESNKQPNNQTAQIRLFKAITAQWTYKRMQADEIRPYRANKTTPTGTANNRHKRTAQQRKPATNSRTDRANQNKTL